MEKALLHGLPVLIVVALIVLVYRRSAGRRISYQLSQPWTHGQLLFAATDEVIPSGQHVGHHHPGETVPLGGGASGHW
ncbi:MAG: aa3-type cytochrome oxidase subunit CtaJ [Mycobacterium sp.]